MTKALLPTGFRDRLPPEADASARLVRSVLDTVASYGYERVQTPLAEYEASLTAALGTSSRDLLRFVDPVSGETMAIRSDITGQIGRIARGRMGHHPRPLRLSYGGPVVTLRATQLRPERELMQVGAELIGLDSVAAVAEVVTVAIESLKNAGARDLTLDLTMPDLIDTLLPGADTADLKARLDAKDAAAVSEAFRPLIAAAGPYAEASARLRTFDEKGVLTARLDALDALVAILPGDVRVTLDPTERHGFEYQSWFGFTIFAKGYSAALGRGGTYYIDRADGPSEAATGFSLYPDPLIDLAEESNVQRLFLPLGTDAATGAKLRSDGWVTVAALDENDSAAVLGCTHKWINGQAVIV